MKADDWLRAVIRAHFHAEEHIAALNSSAQEAQRGSQGNGPAIHLCGDLQPPKFIILGLTGRAASERKRQRNATAWNDSSHFRTYGVIVAPLQLTLIVSVPT
jgi:hypothetical protein